jgi:hypothetical protein
MLIIAKLVNKIDAHYGARRLVTVFTIALEPILSQMNPNIILPSTPWAPTGIYPVIFSG